MEGQKTTYADKRLQKPTPWIFLKAYAAAMPTKKVPTFARSPQTTLMRAAQSMEL